MNSMEEYRKQVAERAANMKYPFVDPDAFKDEQVKHIAYLAVRTEAAHKSIPFYPPIHTRGLEHIDGHDWELYHSNFVLQRDGHVFYYGMFVEGIGAFNMMVADEFVRELTMQERLTFGGKMYGMYGSHSDKLSYTSALPDEIKGGKYVQG